MKSIDDKVPGRVAEADGRPLFGTYRQAIGDASLQWLGDEFAKGGLSRIRSEKRWHFCGVVSEELFASMAIIKLGYASAAFVYVFDRESGEFLLDESAMGPPGPLCRVDDKPIDGASSSFRLPGYRLSLMAPAGEGLIHLRAELGGGWPDLDLALELEHAAAPDAMSAICPVGGKGSVNLTVKQVAMPATGRILVGDKRYDLDSPRSFGLVDYTHGYLDRSTNWMWACAGGLPTARSRRTLGFNLCAGFNEGLENTVWIGEELFHAGPVHFHRGTEGETAPWQISSEDGAVDLTFHPEGMRSEDQDMGIVANHFLQPVGRFVGHVRDKRNRRISIDGLPGICEEHASRW